jgi:hypothetical protein
MIESPDALARRLHPGASPTGGVRRTGGIRTAFAVEAGTTVLAIGNTAGRPYEVGGWEVWAEFSPAYEAGDYEAVIARGRETLAASGYASPLYNLACCEALAGRKGTR